MRSTKVHLLFFLAGGNALSKPIPATTIQIARELGVSQQTASRWLAELSRQGFIEKSALGVKLTRKADAELKSLASCLKPRERISFKGIVCPGLKDGAYYLALPGYSKQFEKLFGWTPFPGTLNLKLDAQGIEAKSALEARRGLGVKGFRHKNQFCGPAKCFPALVNGLRAAIILPERSHYGESVLEVIAPFSLRKKLGLKDGARVTVELSRE